MVGVTEGENQAKEVWCGRCSDKSCLIACKHEPYDEDACLYPSMCCEECECLSEVLEVEKWEVRA